MDFFKAIRAYQDDKTVTHKNYPDKRLHLISTTWVLKNNSEELWVNPDLMLSDGWYIVEESKRTLWDKNLEMFNSNTLKADDVKEALNEFIDWLEYCFNNKETKESFIAAYVNKIKIRDKAKEIFGEELLK